MNPNSTSPATKMKNQANILSSRGRSRGSIFSGYCSRTSLTNWIAVRISPGMPMVRGRTRASGSKPSAKPTAAAKIASMMPLMRMRPSSMLRLRLSDLGLARGAVAVAHLRLARTVDVETDAGDDERDQHHRDRAEEEAQAAER